MHYMSSSDHPLLQLSLHDALPIFRGLETQDDIVLRHSLPKQVGGDALFGPVLFNPELAACNSNVKRDAKLRSEEHTSELQSLRHLVCSLLLEKKNFCIR